jgi:hypothetical protein
MVREFLSSALTSTGDLYTVSRSVRMVRYVKGTLCDKCSECYHNIRIGSDLHPLVKVDPLHGLPKPKDSLEGGRKWKVLNTRFTQ